MTLDVTYVTFGNLHYLANWTVFLYVYIVIDLMNIFRIISVLRN